ncbi:hypothetical protein [Bacillus clarus]|uniref:Uncharacterized protein n=1 Tax=Bacillus clarus TaxID=2338372 RepID=A0A090Z299_9BACI|nr:hypothetical protein [Bacillus clarus]KFN04295.1 hypothetical protein DJ93_5347 [Bacillus clarus]
MFNIENNEDLGLLFKVIQAGGYNLYLRHGEKEPETRKRAIIGDSTTQSNLTP